MTIFFKTLKKILLVLLPLGALGLTACASNPYQQSYAAPAYNAGVYYGGSYYYGLGEVPYDYWYGYGYPGYPGVWDYSPPPLIVNNPPGSTPSPTPTPTPPPPPHPMQPPPAPPGPHRPFIRPAPPERTHSSPPTSPPQ